MCLSLQSRFDLNKFHGILEQLPNSIELKLTKLHPKLVTFHYRALGWPYSGYLVHVRSSKDGKGHFHRLYSPCWIKRNHLVLH